MGNSAASKLVVGDVNDKLTRIRERKRLIKEAGKRRLSLAEAHDQYLQSLNSVATAINLFVNLHSSPGLTFLTPLWDSGVVEQKKEDGQLSSEDEDLRALREQEDTPELEDVALPEKNSPNVNDLTETLIPGKNSELFDALRDIGVQFIRAKDAGVDVSRMMESSIDDRSSVLEEIKENSAKLGTITWHGSPSSLSSPIYSQTSSYHSSSSAGCEGDISWRSLRHSQTLVKLHAWEKKLYWEAKDGEQTRQAYEKECLKLRNLDAKRAGSQAMNKTAVKARESYTRITVALQSAEAILKRAKIVRDTELHPQVIELIQGFGQNWKIMLESHETQKKCISEVTSFTCPSYGRFCSDSERDATQRLEAELRNWIKCFNCYIAEQRAYVEVLDGWISKFFTADIEYYFQKTSNSSYLQELSHDWLIGCKNLPDNAVSNAMKSFVSDIKILWDKQGEEQQQKRKIDILAKELDRKVHAFHKFDNRVHASTSSELKPDINVWQRAEYLGRRSDEIELFSKKVETDKEKHHEYMQEIQKATFNSFEKNLENIFESLTMFSDSQKSLLKCTRIF